MNKIRKSIAILAVIVAAAAAAPSAARASNQAAVEQATKAADAWLKLIDQGKYGESWGDAATIFRGAITKDAWAERVGIVRKPLGAVQSRKVKKAQYVTSLPGAPDGQYVVIQYDTSFANKKSAIETVTPMKDKDGQWRVSGYYIR
jgi:photosystem II stability/assembly factor-like uncharacterized protein